MKKLVFFTENQLGVMKQSVETVEVNGLDDYPEEGHRFEEGQSVFVLATYRSKEYGGDGTVYVISDGDETISVSSSIIDLY